MTAQLRHTLLLLQIFFLFMNVSLEYFLKLKKNQKTDMYLFHVNSFDTQFYDYSNTFSGPGSGTKKASSPKPPSGGGAFKKINDEDEAKYGFQINAAAGWNLKF